MYSSAGAGSHLVERMVAAGDRTSVIDDLSRGRRAWIHPAAELQELDLRNVEALRRCVRKDRERERLILTW
jgi:UDP-glucose 4-epimerase